MDQVNGAVAEFSDQQLVALAEGRLADADVVASADLVELAEALAGRGLWALAAAAFGAAARSRALDGDLFFRQGLMHERDGAFAAAARAYGCAVAAPQRSIKYWYFLGRSHERAGDQGAAAAAYKSYVAQSEAADEPFTKRLGGLLSFEKQIAYGTMAKPAYAYAVYRSALLAKALGLKRITVVELGVAGGRGLLSLEAIGWVVRSLTGVRIRTVGLDTGSGLFRPRDFRDLPHYFAAGDYAMDVELLKGRLEDAELVLGDARETIELVANDRHAPVGALLFDMDTYASTAAVLHALDFGDVKCFLPRVSLYFDDLVPKHRDEWLKDYHEQAGEALAIREFNDSGPSSQILPDRYFVTPPVRRPWHSCMYLLHAFRHPRYSEHLGVSNPGGLALPEILRTGIQRPERTGDDTS